MIRYVNPTTVRHQGRGVLIAERIETDPESGVEARAIVYNILALNPDMTDDGLGWQGFAPLPSNSDRQTSLAGFSVLRLLDVTEASGATQVVSDETHIYIFRADGHSLLVERFLLVETVDANARDGRGFGLVPDWEVRFRRSASPDLPASANDISAYRDPDGTAFLDPRRYLSLAPGPDALDLTLGFTALLLPASEPGRLQWRIFARSKDGGALLGYAIPRLEDGWFDLAAVELDGQGMVLPISGIAPMLEGEGDPTPLSLTGHVAASLYQRLEPMVDQSGAAVQMRTANRVMLACPAIPAGGENGPARLVTFDFEVDGSGGMAFDGGSAQPILAGDTGPDALSVDFALPSSASIAEPVPPTALFTIQAWLCPQNGPVTAEQAGQPRIILSYSKEEAPEKSGLTLEIVDQFRVRLRYGTGEAVISATTSENILSYGGWSNISATCDGNNIAIFLNGAAVPLTISGTPGPVPAGPIDQIGGASSGFVGQLTELRIWSRALSEAEIRANIIAPLENPTGLEGLAAYWPMDGGTGTLIADLSGNKHDAVMVGAVWTPATAPMARPDQPINQIDAANRGLSVGYLKPSDIFPGFGPVRKDARPTVLPTGDGPIHLYYPGSDEKLTVARRSGLAQRAFFTGHWSAYDPAGSPVETGGVAFITRQTGAYNSFTGITLSPGTSETVMDCLFSGPDAGPTIAASQLRAFVRMKDAAQEKWSGVPRRLETFSAIVNGQAVTDPSDPRISEGRACFYDYAGTRFQAYLPLGASASSPALRFVSTLDGDFPLKRVAANGDGKTVTLTIEFANGKGASIRAAFGPVPALADTIVDLLRGRSADVVYAPGKASTPAWALPAGSNSLFLLAPNMIDGAPVVQKAVFTLTAGINAQRVDFAATLTLADKTLDASWVDVPRDASGFIAALQAGGSAEQKAVLAQLVFLDRTQGLLLNGDKVTIDSQSDLRYVTALVAAFREGGGGILPGTFDLEGKALQGVSPPRVDEDGVFPSAIISVQSMTAPTSGYPAVVDAGGTPGTILLAMPGRDGGWLRDVPRYSQSFDGKAALSVDLDRLVPAPNVYEIAGAVTIEGWVRPAESRRAVDNDEETLQSLLHFSASHDDLSYGLAYAPVETPRFFAQVAFTVSEATVPVPAVEDRLVRDGRYTVQLYLRPSLLTAGSKWFWKRQDASGSGDEECLSIIVADGAGSWRLGFTALGQDMQAPVDIAAGRWALVTLVRDGSTAILYIDGVEATRRDDLKQPDIAATAYTVANPADNEFFEFDPNEFAAWNRACSAQEIGETFLRPLSGAEPGLVVLFPLSRRERDFRLTNRARWTTTIYNSQFAGSPFFTATGLFFDLVAGFGAQASCTVTPALAPRRWLHVAAVLNRRGALALSGGGSAAASGDKETRLGGSFAVDARIRLTDIGNARQVIVSRFGADAGAQVYEMGVRQDARAYLTVRLRPVGGGRLASPDQGLVTLLSAADQRILAGKSHHIAATASLMTVNDSVSRRDVTVLAGDVYVDGIGNGVISPPSDPDLGAYRLISVMGGSGSGYYRAGDIVTIKAYDPAHFERWFGNLADITVANNPEAQFTMPGGDAFVDRILAASAFIDPVEFAAPATPTRAGLSGKGSAADGWLLGQISDLRQWSEALSAAQVDEIATQPGATPFDDKLISWWPFLEQAGRLAKDNVGDNDLTLTSSTLWAWFDGAGTTIYVNGHPIPSAGLSEAPLAQTPRQMRIGGFLNKTSTALTALLQGDVDELRLWSGQRSREQIANNMSAYLTGAEAGLVGYWRFDAGSGDLVADRTIHRGDAHYLDAAGTPLPINWSSAAAPVGFDAPIVNDALDTRPSPEAVTLAQGAASISVFEYGDTIRLFDGTSAGVLKRSYVYDGISGMDDDTGYKVGDLERIYIGQVQTDPTVVGFIEGAPPLPSENLTRPLTSPSDVDSYAGIASVTLTDEWGEAMSASSGSEATQKTSFSLSVGGAGSLEKDEVIGIPPIQSAIQSTQFKLELGAQVTGSFESTSSAERAITASAERSITQALANGGEWERKDPEGGYFLESGERRFIPGNVGSALVKSQVADLYALKIPSSGALVSLTAEPNPDIPVDVNIIRFPIDPSYQLAGSLDGRIGLQQAPMTQTSYFNPREAYTLKRDIERQRQRLAAYFTQTNLQAQLGKGADLASVIAANPLFSPDLAMPTRDMVNTYVWSADGGIYSESEGYSTELTESYSLGQSSEIGVGFKFNLFFTIFGIGVTIEGEVNHSFATAYTTTKSFARNRGLKLEVEAEPDPFPYMFKDDEFLPEPVPGKVDGYRFMTFFLANRADNASALFDKVIDQNWLLHSQDPNAAALREASTRSSDTAPWRILHRVTYVSRIPPRFQAVPPLTNQIALPEAPNQAQNAVFLALVRAKLPKTGAASAAEISAAVQVVLYQDLLALLPWWKAYLEAAQIANSPEQQVLARTNAQMIAYAISVIGTGA
jgi:hypothetical protein